MDRKILEAELHGISALIRDHVMYREEYPGKRHIFQDQLLVLIWQFAGVRLDPRVPMEIEILLQDPTVHGLRRILAQAHRDLVVVLKDHPTNEVLNKEERRLSKVLEVLPKHS